MEYLRFDTESEAIAYDHVLLMEVAELNGLPVSNGKVLGAVEGDVTEENPTTAWSNVREVAGIGWLVGPPDWRELNEYESGRLVEWIPDVVDDFGVVNELPEPIE